MLANNDTRFYDTMTELLKGIYDFVIQHIGAGGTGILLLAAALIYIWFQHNRWKLLKEKLSFIEEKKAAVAKELEELSRAVSTPEQSPPEAVLERERTDASRVVLIADDEQMMSELLARMIEKRFEGIPVVTVSDGEEALEHINRHSPSLLILHLMMPRKTVFEVLKDLSHHDERFPILVISAYASSKEDVATLGQIASDRIEFLTKPFNGQELIGIVQKMLSQQNTT